MSQAKVDQYKEFKKNRKAELEKEKKAQARNTLIWKIVGCVLALGLLVAIGITAYNAISRSIQARPDYEREGMILGDVAGIYATTTAEPTTTAPETTAVPETTEVPETVPASGEAGTTAAN